ncbi:fused DSP-PTPase phosphatase/NAD kinase-like protein [Paludisphaera rhizosphaerae]|uniref:fused DSP-PTPase phosphatase/NAD kinase-like protein n=1 Tax=Paludisphaera rhizosphaerae TaxID=2711216 RepID=UPI0013ECBE6E|nr:hypothetical protein [Paludisphaera rhizosphaerae]
MFSLSWLRERGQTRARPSPRRRTAKAVALGFLVATTMLQTGCRSGGFGNGCSLFSPCGFPARATSRIMQPFRRIGGGGACGDGCGQPGCDSPVVYDSPGMVVSPAVPLGAPTTIVPGGAAVPSTVAPTDSPTSLEALPSAAPDAAPSRSSGVRRPSSTSSYDTRRPVQNPGVDLTSAPATRTTRTPASDPGSVLDNLPPLDVPPEVAGRNDNTQAAPAAVKTGASGAAPAASSAPSPTPTTTSASPHDPIGGRAEGAGSLRDTALAAAPAPDVDNAANGAVGVARFVPVDLKLAGGSAPTTVGLGWLAEKGYKTVLDLRDPSKIDPTFMGEAARRGLRYVSFPTDLARLDRNHVERFSAELALDAARPLYFFDEDGRTAGALWYVRSALNDKVGWDVARRDAESMGLIDAASWKVVRDFVDASLGTKTAAPVETPKPSPAPTAPVPKQAHAPAEHHLADASTPVAVPEPPKPVRGSDDYSDAWKSVAALFLTGLTFRAAFIGRASIATIRARTRASLPAPSPRS